MSAVKRQRTLFGDVRKKEEKTKDISGNWKTNGSIIWGDFGSQSSEKILAFDLDGTLIVTKSKKRFAQNRNDWLLFDPIKTPLKIKAYHDDGYKIVVFTNQLGVATGKTSAEDIQGKLMDIQEELSVPMQCFILTADDINRKPRVGAWVFMTEECNDNKKVDMELSLYVGDAAGRMQGAKKKDFNDTDLKFALNMGVIFQTPESFFLETKDLVPTEFEFDPRRLGECVSASEFISCPHGAEDAPEVVVLVGAPGSGKSTLASRFPGYVVINQDTLRTKEKCLAHYKTALQDGKSVVVDSQNKDIKSRVPYIEAAKHKNMYIHTQLWALLFRCVYESGYLEIPEELMLSSKYL